MQVDIVEFLYEPEEVTVAAGTTVTWTNQDKAPHTSTARDDSFDTGTLKKGDSGEIVLDTPGTYEYFCRFHQFMNGTHRGAVARLRASRWRPRRRVPPPRCPRRPRSRACRRGRRG